MRKTSIILLFIAVLIGSCKKEQLEPSCLNEFISELKDSPCEDGVQISLFKFQSTNVYLLEQGNCIADGTTEVIDAACQSLGFLGGLAGSDEINGVNFSENSTFIEVVWRK
ncbi:hypothetical protein SAMN05661096_00202 [Marivirga sericea]|uniref:DUF6970 domain-containing protein n=1 Tax=Marivirga sericea TaxID=1028 RepID=A0A1X7I556_9BACT|nr:hypothetical protein [Marivirga sericea]SMG09349.1 hypothetical protein SAMN05661096_00202 [Marivirga sericea]